MAITRGLDEDRLLEQMDEIDRLNEEIGGIRILKGIEVDILEDGSLDLEDWVLDRLDIVVAAVHSSFKLSKDKQTERVLRAIDNPVVNVIAHPTGRLIGEREGYQLDIEKIMTSALEKGCFMELNAQPARLDLNDIYLKLARDMGLKVAISTDSHSSGSLPIMRYGINQARRGWIGPDDVINTRPLEGLLDLLKRG